MLFHHSYGRSSVYMENTAKDHHYPLEWLQYTSMSNIVRSPVGDNGTSFVCVFGSAIKCLPLFGFEYRQYYSITHNQCKSSFVQSEGVWRSVYRSNRIGWVWLIIICTMAIVFLCIKWHNLLQMNIPLSYVCIQTNGAGCQHMAFVSWTSWFAK